MNDLAKFNQWPEAFNDLKRCLLATGPRVLLGEHHNDEADGVAFDRMLCVGLVDPDQYRQISLDEELGHEVEFNGPYPTPREFGLDLKFSIQSGTNPDSLEIVPIVHSWTQHVHTTLLPDSVFLATYGLSPSVQSNPQKIVWNDLSVPEYGVVECIPYSKYDHTRSERAFVDCCRRYFQDYCNLLQKQAICFFYEHRVVPAIGVAPEQATDEELNIKEALIWRQYLDSSDQIVHQIWGRHTIHLPSQIFPVSGKKSGKTKHIWPGSKQGTNSESSFVFEFVYVSDAVLAVFEGKPDYSIMPCGSVSFGSQWSVGFCQRVGRDGIRLEKRKLYECAPPEVTELYFKHAIDPVPSYQWKALNVATRTKHIVSGVIELLAVLKRISDVNAPDEPRSPDQLTAANAKYYGWWNLKGIDTVMRHIPKEMTEEMFVARCKSLCVLAIESISEKQIRRQLKLMGFEHERIKELRSLRLLNMLAHCASIARDSGLQLPEDSQSIVERALETGFNPSLVGTLEAVNAARQLDAHGFDNGRFARSLARLNQPSPIMRSELGYLLDDIYDRVARELKALVDLLVHLQSAGDQRLDIETN